MSSSSHRITIVLLLYLVTALGSAISDILLLLTLDGQFLGLNPSDGSYLWTSRSTPVLHVTPSFHLNLDDDSRCGIQIIPSIYGQVLLQYFDDVTGTSQLVRTSGEELMSKMPFVDKRGHYFTGMKRVSLVGLEVRTGAFVTSIDESNEVIWLGKIEYEVKVSDRAEGRILAEFNIDSYVPLQEFVPLDGYNSNDILTYIMSQNEDQILDNLWSYDLDDKFYRDYELNGLSTMGTLDLFSNQERMLSTPSSRFVFINANNVDKPELKGHEHANSPVIFAFKVLLSNPAFVTYTQIPVNLVSDRYLDMFIGKMPNSKDISVNEISGNVQSDLIFRRLISPFDEKDVSLYSLFIYDILNEYDADISDDDSNSLQLIQASMNHGNIDSEIGSLNSHVLLDQSDLNFLQQQDLGALLEYFNEMRRQAQHQQQQHSQNQSWNQFFTRIMASWIPPAVALAFVVSFELGRRERLRSNRLRQFESLGGNLLSDDLSSVIKNVGPKSNSDSKLISTHVIQVSDHVLGYGGHGTVVYKGNLEGRQVAVKKMLKAYHASADREISLLISSDGHENVVRYFLKEVRGDFVYLALELCEMSLQDLVMALCKYQAASNAGILVDNAVQANIPSFSKGVINTLRQISNGVKHIHSLRIVHRDLKPQNILLARRNNKADNSDAKSVKNFRDIYNLLENGEYIPKISDMGLGKQLAGQSSFGMSTYSNRGNHIDESSLVGAGGPGSVGWQAPEVMALRQTVSDASSQGNADSFTGHESMSPLDFPGAVRTSRSVDIFSLGCIFHCLLLPGVHPFGEWYEREANIMRGKPSLDRLKMLSSAGYDLVSSMIHRDPKLRPTAGQVCVHPFFWSKVQKIAFLCELSDRMELDPASSISIDIEQNASTVVGFAWDEMLEPELLSNVSRFRSYDPSSVRHCLRIIRNKYHHYDELPQNLRYIINPEKPNDPNGLIFYFERTFPNLLMHCYNTCRLSLSSDCLFRIKYEIPTTFSSCNVGVRDTPCVKKSLPTVIERDNQRIPVETMETYEHHKVLSSDLTDKTEANETYIHKDPVESPSTIVVNAHSSVVMWQGSEFTKTNSCRGWMRSDAEWQRATDKMFGKKPDTHDKNDMLLSCAGDSKFRTRLCNHWDESQGTFCPMRKKNRCIFAHGPVELRVKEGKRNRWGTLADKRGNHSNPNHSGGEDTYGAARSVESMRKTEGKWGNNNNVASKQRGNGQSRTPKRHGHSKQ